MSEKWSHEQWLVFEGRYVDRIAELEAENARLQKQHDDNMLIRERMYQRDCQHRTALQVAVQAMTDFSGQWEYYDCFKNELAEIEHIRAALHGEGKPL